MAKLKVLPHQDIISGLKGKIDFYLWRGIPVARKWPRSPGHLRAQAVMDQWSTFTLASQGWMLLTEQEQDAYRHAASGTGLTGRDLFTRSYITGIHAYEAREEEMITLYKARVHKDAADQNINNNTDTKLTFDVEDYDPQGCFDLPNDRFIALEAGYYLCISQARFSTPVANKSYAIGIRKNGAWHAFSPTHSSTTDKMSIRSLCVVQLDPDEFAESWIWQGSGGADAVAKGTFNTFFEIHRLS